MVCDTKMDSEFYIIDMRCHAKHIGTCCKNKFTKLDQIIISHMILSVNSLLHIVIDTIFSSGLYSGQCLYLTIFSHFLIPHEIVSKTTSEVNKLQSFFLIFVFE